MAKKATGYQFKTFTKTYNRYVRDYYRRARQIYKHENGLPARSRLHGVSKETLRSYMKDNEVLNRTDFREYYRSYKKELADEGLTTDPVQQIVSDQAYEYSYKQYKGFKIAVKKEGFEKKVKDIEKISLQDFRRGKWKTKEFFDAAKDYYKEMLEQGREKGLADKELWMYAKEEVSNLFFGSE